MLSGDWTEFHTNDEYARESTFGERIAHGPLTFSVAIGLMYRCGFLTRTSVGLAAMDEVAFVSPLPVGETVHVDLEVVDTHDISREDAGIVRWRWPSSRRTAR
jgi:acyl dehydratase